MKPWKRLHRRWIASGWFHICQPGEQKHREKYRVEDKGATYSIYERQGESYVHKFHVNKMNRPTAQKILDAIKTLEFPQELIKFKLLVGMQQMKNGTYDDAKFKTELQGIYDHYYGSGVRPLFLK